MDSMSPRYQENFLPSPHHSHGSNSSCSSSSTSNGVHPQNFSASPTPTAPPQPPKPITRSESANPYPTTFVQADTSSFKQVVQMLTGSSETGKQALETSSSISKSHNIPPIKPMPKKQQQQQQQSGFKLYERRNSFKNLNINPVLPVFSSPNAYGFSPRKPEVLSPSILDFPALALSPVTPLIPDPFDRSGATGYRWCSDNNGSPGLDVEAEEKAIKEKGFFLHRSPASTPRDTEPRLLPLFPTTSPRASGSSSAS